MQHMRWRISCRPILLDFVQIVLIFKGLVHPKMKRMDSLQGAFIHPPEPCEGRFITNVRTLFDVFRTGSSKHPFSPIVRLGGARTIFNITPIGFV